MAVRVVRALPFWKRTRACSPIWSPRVSSFVSILASCSLISISDIFHYFHEEVGSKLSSPQEFDLVIFKAFEGCFSFYSGNEEDGYLLEGV